MKVFFACPSHDGKVVADFSNSMFRTAELFNDVGIGSDVMFVSCNAYVDLARDILTHEFMKSDCTHILQLDADIGWEPEDLVRMLEKGRDFIVGAYPMKEDPPRFAVNFNRKQKDGLIGASGVPGGFNLISRDAIKKARTFHVELSVEGVPELPGEAMVALHSHDIHEGRFWGEDMAFSRRMIEAGIDIWIDPYTNLRHWDGKRCYDHKLIGTVVREIAK